eukprot:GFYU01001316.1.p1 GENE.GFYU01001316.1~~GFYU01001316.1.p1  ORF type:complete len:455 (-),score=54.65 GFYU01001316.1:48-1412(-)
MNTYDLYDSDDSLQPHQTGTEDGDDSEVLDSDLPSQHPNEIDSHQPLSNGKFDYLNKAENVERFLECIPATSRSEGLKESIERRAGHWCTVLIKIKVPMHAVEFIGEDSAMKKDLEAVQNYLHSLMAVVTDHGELLLPVLDPQVQPTQALNAFKRVYQLLTVGHLPTALDKITKLKPLPHSLEEFRFQMVNFPLQIAGRLLQQCLCHTLWSSAALEPADVHCDLLRLARDVQQYIEDGVIQATKAHGVLYKKKREMPVRKLQSFLNTVCWQTQKVIHEEVHEVLSSTIGEIETRDAKRAACALVAALTLFQSQIPGQDSTSAINVAARLENLYLVKTHRKRKGYGILQEMVGDKLEIAIQSGITGSQVLNLHLRAMDKQAISETLAYENLVEFVGGKFRDGKSYVSASEKRDALERLERDIRRTIYTGKPEDVLIRILDSISSLKHANQSTSTA